MINWRIKDFNSPPTILSDSTRLEAQKEAEKSLNGDEIKSFHYRNESVLKLLKAYSIGKTTIDETKELAKCFYCESTSEVVASLQVEHYRPKKVIHDAKRRIVPNTHGYYWLGIEWTNLVLACPKCNGSGAKGNIFTIRGSYIGKDTSLNTLLTSFDRSNCYANKKPLLDEKPDLLHPEIDNSYKYLKYNEFGENQAKLNRGQKTIDICDLNRDSLNIARYQLIKSHQNSFLEIVEFHRDGLISRLSETEGFFIKKCKELKAKENRSLPYTLLARYMNENFEDFFVKNVPVMYRRYLRNAYNTA